MSHSTTPQYIISCWGMNSQQSWLRLPHQKCRSKFTIIPLETKVPAYTSSHLSSFDSRGKAIHNISKACSGGDSSTAENHWNTLTCPNKLRRGIDRTGLVLLYRAWSWASDYKVVLCSSLYLTSRLHSWNSLGYRYQGLQMLATQLHWQCKVTLAHAAVHSTKHGLVCLYSPAGFLAMQSWFWMNPVTRTKSTGHFFCRALWFLWYPFVFAFIFVIPSRFGGRKGGIFSRAASVWNTLCPASQHPVSGRQWQPQHLWCPCPDAPALPGQAQMHPVPQVSSCFPHG